MGVAGIPEAVQKFVRDHIDSVEQLEVLLLLHRSAPRAWTVAEVSRDLRIEPASAARRLHDMHVRGLVRHRSGSQDEFWIERGTPDDDVLRSLDATYSERRVTLIEFIFAAPVRDVRVFADAFRIRKKEE